MLKAQIQTPKRIRSGYLILWQLARLRCDKMARLCRRKRLGSAFAGLRRDSFQCGTRGHIYVSAKRTQLPRKRHRGVSLRWCYARLSGVGTLRRHLLRKYDAQCLSREDGEWCVVRLRSVRVGSGAAREPRFCETNRISQCEITNGCCGQVGG